jgi:hypothetical protein
MKLPVPVDGYQSDDLASRLLAPSWLSTNGQRLGHIVRPKTEREVSLARRRGR